MSDLATWIRLHIQFWRVIYFALRNDPARCWIAMQEAVRHHDSFRHPHLMTALDIAFWLVCGAVVAGLIVFWP